jgi:hypothetical protein
MLFPLKRPMRRKKNTSNMVDIRRWRHRVTSLQVLYAFAATHMRVNTPLFIRKLIYIVILYSDIYQMIDNMTIIGIKYSFIIHIINNTGLTPLFFNGPLMLRQVD